MGDVDGAGDHFRSSALLARRSGAALFELRALCDLARNDQATPDDRRRLESLAGLDWPAADRWRLECVGVEV